MENQIPENNQSQTNDFWQTEVSGKIYDTTISEMSQWITEGALMPTDKVRRGNLRWLEAGKIPPLMPFFSAKESNLPLPFIAENKTHIAVSKQESTLSKEKCTIHSDENSVFCCESCVSNYCESCLSSINDNNKSCPMCGAICELNMPVQTANKQTNYSTNNEVENVNSPQTEQKSNNFPNVSFPSDVMKTPNKKGFGMFAIIVISVLASGLGAYLWAYQYSNPNQTLEDSLPEIVSLDEKFKAEMAKYEKMDVEIAANKAQKENLKKINQTKIVGNSFGCKNELGKSIECNPMLEKFNKTNAETSSKMNETYEKLNDPSRFEDQNIKFPSISLSIKNQYTKERSKIIENYRESRSKRNFLITFFVSFAALFSGLTGIRKLSNR